MLKPFLILMAVLLAWPSTQARAQAGAAPFDADLQRLSEILGALHYLRDLCGAKEGQKWRNEMKALIEAETSAGERRARIVASFNRGYRASSRPTAPARRRPIWPSAAIWTKAPKSPARSRPATPINALWVLTFPKIVPLRRGCAC